MERNSLMVWFIVIVMVGSILGYTALFQNQEPVSFPDDLPEVENPTSIEMSVSDVNGTVFQVLPILHLIAKTTESDIMKINRRIGDIEGIYKITARYSSSDDPRFSSSLLYVADISFDDSRLDYLQLGKAVQEKTSGKLDFVAIYGTALVSVPVELRFENKEFGMSLDYELEGGLVQTTIAAATRKDDEIILLIEASFAGSQLVGGTLNGFEISNLATEPQQILLEKELEINSLEKRLFVSAEVPFSFFVSFSELEKGLASIEGIESASVGGNQPSPEATLLITDTRIAAFREDLNAFLSIYQDAKRIESFSFNEAEEGLKITLSLRETFNAKGFIADLNSFLYGFDIDFESIELNEPEGFYQIDLNTSSEQTFGVSQRVRDFLQEKVISILFIQQYGTVVLESLTDPKTENVFFFDEQEQKALFNPGHVVGETVLLEILAQGSRGKIILFNAAEKEEQ